MVDFFLKLEKSIGSRYRYRINNFLKYFGLILLYTHKNVKESEQFHIERYKKLKKELICLEDRYKNLKQSVKKKNKKDKDKLYRWAKRVKSVGKCDICNSTEELTAHHLWDKMHHPTLMYQDENGVCLCKTCHEEFHNIYSSCQVTPKMYEKFKIKKKGLLILQHKID